MREESGEDLRCEGIHAGEGEAFFAEVFKRCADMVERLAVKNKKTVVKIGNHIDLDGGVLFVVFLEVEVEMFADLAGVNRCGN